MPIQCRRIVLSRFFNSNVELVANMCPVCYEECVDVRIISVNLHFLNKTTNDFENEKFKDFNFLNISPVIEKGSLGFSKEEIDKSVNYAERVNRIVDNERERIAELEKDLAESKSDSFNGFALGDAHHSVGEYKKAVKACDEVRYQMYRRVSLRVVQNLKNRAAKKSLRKARKEKVADNQAASRYFKAEPKKAVRSKFFSISFANNNVAVSFNKQNVKVEKCDQPCAGTIKTEPIESIDYESEYFAALRANQLKLDSKEATAKAIPKDGFETVPMWVPPRSPHNLIEEVLYHDPWALLVATIFLNRTTCMCARPYVFWFLADNPDPLKVLDKFPEDLEKYFVNLGLQRTRAVQVWRMSHDFVYKDWRDVKDLYGIGEYGQNAFRMFCLGDFGVEPKDRFLRIYKAWYEKVERKARLV